MSSKLVSIVVIWLFLAAAANNRRPPGLAGHRTRQARPIPRCASPSTNVADPRIAVTDGEGRFSIPALPPATYHIKVELHSKP